MKRIILVLIMILLIPSLNTNAQITLKEIPGNDIAQEIIEEVPEETKKLMEEFGIDEISPQSLLSLSFSDFLSFIFKSIKIRMAIPLKQIVLILGITVMCALLKNFKTSFSSESISRIFDAVATVSVVLIMGDGIIDCIKKTCNIIQGYNTFMLSFIPVYAGSVTVAGAPITSGVYSTFMFFACQVIGTLINNTIMPLLCIYLGLSIASGINEQLKLESITQAIKKTATWSLTLLMTIFTGIMSIQTVIANASDSVATKTGKYILSSFVPVVGSALSEVFLSVQGCMKLLKNCIGGYCLVAVAVTFVPILLELVVWKACVFISQIFSEILNIKPISTLAKSLSSTFSVLIAIVLVFSLLIIVSTTLMLILGQGRY